MHGGRELIYEPLLSEEENRAENNRSKGNVTEFRRPAQTSAIQENDRNSTVIPFRIQNDPEKKGEQPEGRRAGRKAQTPKVEDERD